ncbi:MAG: hypothetical protein KKD01_02855 [Proteobacteria bacterium]|nr:hypothetical protein [Pseudomonadota bacterium]MBU1232398.1 hypothetical protein [Pseudomonadota bacterium]MBU1417185.1 hypothetical protein [Pseudomonadota bacterium]MBU1453641.1 hypothetical protein [Pseudomonadota bacterium]
MVDGKQDDELRREGGSCGADELIELKLKVPADLYRAYQRCSWIIINETGRGQLEIMEEMVYDFLVKKGC